jgi:hypothetical protein
VEKALDVSGLKELGAATQMVHSFCARAEKYFAQALSLDDSSVASHRGFARFLLRTKRHDESEQHLLAALELCAEQNIELDSECLQNLSIVLECKGNTILAALMRERSGIWAGAKARTLGHARYNSNTNVPGPLLGRDRSGKLSPHVPSKNARAAALSETHEEKEEKAKVLTSSSPALKVLVRAGKKMGDAMRRRSPRRGSESPLSLDESNSSLRMSGERGRSSHGGGETPPSLDDSTTAIRSSITMERRKLPRASNDTLSMEESRSGLRLSASQSSDVEMRSSKLSVFKKGGRDSQSAIESPSTPLRMSQSGPVPTSQQGSVIEDEDEPFDYVKQHEEFVAALGVLNSEAVGADTEDLEEKTARNRSLMVRLAKMNQSDSFTDVSPPLGDE